MAKEKKVEAEKPVSLFTDKEAYEQMSYMHTQQILETRKANMAFTELLSRVPDEIVQEAFYDLKEAKVKKAHDDMMERIEKRKKEK